MLYGVTAGYGAVLLGPEVQLYGKVSLRVEVQVWFMVMHVPRYEGPRSDRSHCVRGKSERQEEWEEKRKAVQVFRFRKGAQASGAAVRHVTLCEGETSERMQEGGTGLVQGEAGAQASGAAVRQGALCKGEKSERRGRRYRSGSGKGRCLGIRGRGQTGGTVWQ